jgi:hypothetical protein
MGQEYIVTGSYLANYSDVMSQIGRLIEPLRKPNGNFPILEVLQLTPVTRTKSFFTGKSNAATASKIERAVSSSIVAFDEFDQSGGEIADKVQDIADVHNWKTDADAAQSADNVLVYVVPAMTYRLGQTLSRLPDVGVELTYDRLHQIVKLKKADKLRHAA